MHKNDLFVSIMSAGHIVQSAGFKLINSTLENPVDQALGELFVVHDSLSSIIRLLENFPRE